MKFFVMLAVLILRGLPGQRLTRPLDRSFRAWQLWLAARLASHPGAAAVFLIAILPSVFLLWFLLWWLEGRFWSLPTLLIHLAVVFYALGRRSELLWVERYRIAWRQGDHQAASYYAEEILQEEVGNNASELHSKVMSRLAFFAFDRLFFVLFWYLLLGPIGALLARLSEQAILTAQQQRTSAEEMGCDEQVRLFHSVLEWPAARLMGLTLALVGRPLAGLQQLITDLPRWSLTSEAFINRQFLVSYGLKVSGQSREAVECQRPEMMTDAADRELHLLQERVGRMLAIWVAASAVGVIFFS